MHLPKTLDNRQSHPRVYRNLHFFEEQFLAWLGEATLTSMSRPTGLPLPERYIPVHSDFQRYICSRTWPRLPVWVKEALLMGKVQLGELHRLCIRRRTEGTLGTGDGWQYSKEGSHFWLDGQKVGLSLISGEDKTVETVRDLEGAVIYEAEWDQHALKQIRVPKTDLLARKGSRIAMILREAYDIYTPSPESG